MFDLNVNNDIKFFAKIENLNQGRYLFSAVLWRKP